jgi:hypothetical protein
MIVRNTHVHARTRLPAMLLVGAALLHAATASAQTAASYRLVRQVDAVVSNTNATLTTTDNQGDSEPSIAVNPANPNQIVMLSFSGSAPTGTNAPLWQSTDGGQTWTKSFSIPQPPGVSAIPSDQTLDYGRNNQLSLSFLNCGAGCTNVVTGVTNNPGNAASFVWNQTAGVTQLTNANTATSINNADQPWVLVNRDPTTAAQDDTYVAYDDFSVRNVRVAVSLGANPLNFTRDRQVGTFSAGINPGLRLAKDPSTGTIYALWQTCTANCGSANKTISYMLNRSVDGGNTWRLNGNALGISIASGVSAQPTPKFGTVNFLLGGVEHAAVDPATGALYYVYGNQDASGNNVLAIRRITVNNAGTATIGAQTFVTTGVTAALPQVAVDTAGTVAVFYYTYDSISPAPANIPTFTTHVGISVNAAASFTNMNLSTFASPVPDDLQGAATNQRVFGDYVQMKSNGNCFHGVYTANGAAFGRPFADTDPIYFQICGDRSETFGQIVGTATTLPFPAGNLQITGVFNSNDALNLGAATVTVTQMLRQGATELVLGVPVTLSPTLGGSPTAGNYLSLIAPTATMQINELPLVGRVVQITMSVTGVSVSPSCPLLAGVANLTTSFRVDDGVHPAVVVRGTNPWACVGLELVSP